MQGDVRTGAGIDAAVDGIDVVVHAATSPRHIRATEVGGTRLLIDSLRRHGAGHLVYVSIVGVDRHRFPYYRMKKEAERVIEVSSVPWTIQRATQFHDLINRFLSSQVFIRTPKLAFQAIDPGDVADRLVSLVEQGPVEHAPDFGGPEILSMTAMAAARALIISKRTMLLPVPRLGFLRDFDEGHHLCPDHRDGTVTWAEWLHRRAKATSAI